MVSTKSSSFMKKVDKELKSLTTDMCKLDDMFTLSFGHPLVNYVMTGNPLIGIYGGRVTGISGPSGSGKSFTITGLVKDMQLMYPETGNVLILDSENALDDQYLTKAGIDINNDSFMYRRIDTIEKTQASIVSVVNAYKTEFGNEHVSKQPPFLIVVDSLDMLLTETEKKATVDKGDFAFDRGVKTRMRKTMLNVLVKAIEGTNIGIVVTSHVYEATQDKILSGEGKWVVNSAMRYALSQIMLVTRLKLKSKESGDVTGIRMNCLGFKTRFTKPFQDVTIEVKWDEGIVAMSGVIEFCEETGILLRKGNRYYFPDDPENLFYGKNGAEHYMKMVDSISKLGNLVIKSGDIDADAVETDLSTLDE